ncbi:MAG: KamA family radical SAM protein [Sphaerochaeta sp.]|nr:KamA family radical SAM protein [Sphaerochaeta sp.]
MAQHQAMERAVVDDAEPPLLHVMDANGRPGCPPNPPSALDGRIETFRRTHYPDTSDAVWENWHFQLSHRITTAEELSRFLTLSEAESAAFERADALLSFAITPHYLSLIDPNDRDNALRKSVVPTIAETIRSADESDDPLGEGEDSLLRCLVHRYPDRVLFLTTNFCSTYCRYCTRSRMVGHSEALSFHWQKGLDYIASHPEIRDVVVSGGDPLTLSDEVLDSLLASLFAISHVEMVRIGTKVPMVMPQRITEGLLQVLRRYKPLYMSVHATHPDELSSRSVKALNDLADSGVVLGSQTVLLKGINDSPETLRSLFHSLLKVRVKPYYLYQCDPISGSEHFRTTVDKGKALMATLRGFTSGYAVPQYVIDTPGGGGKVPILPAYEVGQDDHALYLRNWEGNIYRYPTLREVASC